MCPLGCPVGKALDVAEFFGAVVLGPDTVVGLVTQQPEMRTVAAREQEQYKSYEDISPSTTQPVAQLAAARRGGGLRCTPCRMMAAVTALPWRLLLTVTLLLGW